MALATPHGRQGGSLACEEAFLLSQGIQSQSQAEFDLRRTRVTGSTTSQGTTVELFGPAAFSIQNGETVKISLLNDSIYYLRDFYLE